MSFGHLARFDETHVHVTQHIIAQDYGWLGAVTADPEYDLTIHNADPDICGGFYSDGKTARSCIVVEHADPHSGFVGWSNILPGLGLLIAAYINHKADARLADQLQDIIIHTGQNGGALCFPSGEFTVDNANQIFNNQGFGNGGLTVCVP
jgi:hypothetical protein